MMPSNKAPFIQNVPVSDNAYCNSEQWEMQQHEDIPD
jgi:hypothetical protein